MPERLSDDEFDALLTERDAFKLAIRGQAALEAELHASIAEAFPGQMPAELQRLSFPTRLALAEAVGVVPPNFRACFQAFASLRHDSAHGDIQDLTIERAWQLRELMLNTISEDQREDIRSKLGKSEPVYTPVLVLAYLRTVIKTAHVKRASGATENVTRLQSKRQFKRS
jgi:hypothetical protein